MSAESYIVETDDLIIRKLDSNPALLALHQLYPDRYPFLLESTSEPSTLARYDILFAFPGEVIVAPDNDLDAGQPNFLDQMDAAWRQAVKSSIDDGGLDLPFTGGWFLFLSYELAGQIENLSGKLSHDIEVPLAFAARVPAALIHDRHDNVYWLVVEHGRADSANLIDRILNDAARAKQSGYAPVHISAMEEESPDHYIDAIGRAKHYIREGDIFQANLSRQWDTLLQDDATPDQVYAHLRISNPAPFAGLARLPSGTTIISSSPERLVAVRGRQISTRPIAGTYPRSKESVIDGQQSAELLAHPKERAEHIMLIDLERNDLGRVCVPGSISVPELMVLESYEYVHHIVSEVRGTLREQTTPGEVIAATFPGGTITGCPKVRCMEIIAELEQGSRGAYTGSMGYLNRDGSLDLNILIRTMVQHEKHLHFRAGAGIVADSVPQRELEETRAKAQGMIRALDEHRHA